MASEQLQSRVTVSAIVSTRNVVEYVGAALTSIAEQTRPPDEVVVVDGRSTDGTLDVIAQFPGVHVIHQQDDGLAAARNLGLAETTGSVIAFLDADDWWEPTKTARQLEALADTPDVGVVAGQMQRMHVASNGSAEVETVPALTPGGVLIRRAVLSAVGGFDERYEIGSDSDWFMRVRAAGFGPLLLPELVLHKGVRPEQLSRNVTRYREELMQVVRDAARRRTQE